MNEISERIATIENCVESCQAKIDSVGKELGSLASDVRSVLDWIKKRFGKCKPGRVSSSAVNFARKKPISDISSQL